MQCDRALTPGGSGVLADSAKTDEEFRKAWLPYFCRSGQRETSLDEFNVESGGWLPHLEEVSLPTLTGDMLFEVVKRKSATAGSLDGWGWRELKVLPVAWYDGLARILTKVEELGVWPDGLLDAYIAMIPKVDGDATPLGQRPLSVLPVVYCVWASAWMLQLEPWFRSWVPSCVFSAGGGRCSVEAWFTTALDIEEVLSGVVQSDVHVFVADVIKSFDTVDRGILDRVLSSLGLPGWFRHAYFECHSSVRLRFKLAAGLGQPWTRDGGIPQGCPLSMMFIVALYLPWCRYLAAQEGVQPQLFADNLMCVSGDPGVLLRAAWFTTGYVRLLGRSLLLASMFVIWVDIWTLFLGVGRLLLLSECVLFLLGCLLSLLCLFIFMVGCVYFGICLFLVLCMVLRLPFWLSLVFVSCGLLFARCPGLVGSLWLMWVLCSVC